jgi:hypothetical protein
MADMENMISALDFCASHNIEFSFIISLEENGLIEVTRVENIEYVYTNQLPQLEKIVRLYYDLDINLEGIDTITSLLQRIEDMQNEISILRNRLRFYENID